ncbi:TatD family hydrolase [Alicyclobacillus tolerans]|uniref:TatD family hydrolase n=1 Tax=Alicyclobacillus tolerans TaxID=90970 RepID=UPI001F23A3DE|nr:TatD family hydrolase [Alicyclobacillus tolerans]MCF8566285.1 TatD family hydrolase [Alicyclobacillus tolerans]
MLFDTHCHLFDEKLLGDLKEVVERAKEAGVAEIVVPAVDVETSRQAIAIAEQFDGVYAAVGVHPEAANDASEEDFAEVAKLALHPKVVAIGEIGLDYYWDAAPRPKQQDVLVQQIRLAKQLGLPVAIHNRDATQDTVRILEQECKGDVHGVMHCFTGSFETAKQCMELGFFISFGGPVTFKNARNVREVAAKIPDEWLVVETDSPYLTPHPHRGKRNEPSYVALVAQMLAEVRGQDIRQLESYTTDNAHRLFPKIG